MVGIFTYMKTINLSHSWIGKYTVRPMGIRHGFQWFLKFTCTANGRKAWCSRGRCTSFTPGRLENGDWPEAFPMTDSHGTSTYIYRAMNGCYGTGIFTEPWMVAMGRLYIYLHEWLPWDDCIFTYMNGCHGTRIFTYTWLKFYGKLVGKIYTMTMDGSYGIAWLCYIIFMVV